MAAYLGHPLAGLSANEAASAWTRALTARMEYLTTCRSGYVEAEAAAARARELTRIAEDKAEAARRARLVHGASPLSEAVTDAAAAARVAREAAEAADSAAARAGADGGWFVHCARTEQSDSPVIRYDHAVVP